VIGSEGTLAIVTAARLRLVPWYRNTAAALVGCASFEQAVHVLTRLRAVPSLDAVEVLMADALQVACAHLGITAPLSGHRLYVMVDCAAHHDPTDELAAAVAEFEGVLAVGPQRDELFRIRDHVTIAISALGKPVKLDVAVPLHQLDELVRRVDHVAAATNTAPIVFGHLAEGNLHVNLLNARDDRDRLAITETVLRAAIELGGTISAEHGIGVAKTQWLAELKGPAAMAAMRSLKNALDPDGLLNPGVILA
jgi:FAD/FMN-containing dehydrogenase